MRRAPHPLASPVDVVIDSSELNVLQLQAIADEIVIDFDKFRPEFSNLVRLQRNIGCRVNELFASHRWQQTTIETITLQPGKGNALRILSSDEVFPGLTCNFTQLLDDMSRLPRGQYERFFSQSVRSMGLWRQYSNGFLHPSTHFFRHVKIKLLNSRGAEKNFIASYIGEKNTDNLDYYIGSKFFLAL